MSLLPQPMRWMAQALLYAAFGAAIGLFSSWPVYRHLPEGHAVVKVSIVHQGARLHPCEERSAEELAKLPPTMRVPQRCPRERAPLLLELDIDGETVLQREAFSRGLKSDGSAAIYQRLVIPAGAHDIAVRLRDTPREDGFDHQHQARVDLDPAQVLVVDFSQERGGLLLR